MVSIFVLLYPYHDLYKINKVIECIIFPPIVDFWEGMYSSVHKNLLNKSCW